MAMGTSRIIAAGIVGGAAAYALPMIPSTPINAVILGGIILLGGMGVDYVEGIVAKQLGA